jgi:hypothetical protein
MGIRTWLGGSTLALFLVVAPAALASTDHAVSGTSSMKYTLTVFGGFGCNPPSEPLCRYRITGTYAEDSGYMGSGRMKGRIILDYTNVTEAGQCVPTKGVLKFDNGGGWVRAALAKGQVSCPQPDPDLLDQSWSLTVKPGAGNMAAVTSGLLTWTSTVARDASGNLLGDAAWSGTLVSVP